MVRRIVLLMWLCVGLSAQAEQVVDVYRVDRQVADQSEAERIAAAKATLGEVVVRASGDVISLQHPLVREAINAAPEYVQKFSYSEDRTKPSDTVKLTLNYSAPAIESILHQAQLRVWPNNRPVVLVWLVHHEAGVYRKLADGAAWSTAVQRAQFRGLPLVAAKWDSEDTQIISEQAVGGLEVDKIRAASQRYKADAILVGRYSRVGEGWKASWQLLEPTPLHFDSQLSKGKVSELGSLFANGVDQLANHFAKINATQSDKSDVQTLKIRVEKVQNFTAFKQVQVYLDSLKVIRRSQLLAVHGNTLVFNLTLEGDVELVKNTLALDNKLQLQTEEPAAEGAQTQPNQLLFHWQD